MSKRLVLLTILAPILAAGGWALFHFNLVRRMPVQSAAESFVAAKSITTPTWAEAVEKARAERTDPGGPIEVPPELRHYSDRYWFLATQVAEISKYNVHTCQDFLDLAAMIQRGEVVGVPGVTETYVLMGVGQRADESEFTAYQPEPDPVDDDKEKKDDAKHEPEKPQTVVVPDYGPLQELAKNYAGRSYNLTDPADRQQLKLNMLSSLRPEALKVLEEVAAAYHRQFDRPLPISSLIRPEQYQHSLRRVNRNAVTIDSPPHSTGLAFDIDYRFMNGTEQTFVMAELARLKNAGRIEAIRERNANYHVFVFLNGVRPPDELIEASLQDAGAPDKEANHVDKQPPSKKASHKKAPRKKQVKNSRTRKHRR
jgi:uncharacterized protein DUF5715